ncbi:hypothetical protein AM501_23935 [Aneurinibacillus migulanus]|uniref:Flp pilus assembly protein CpaB n=1 Tax=Aneurinibacillus migulanus TaxID=47500 RepID=UPI0005BCF1AD|nr:hypothetical protein [Aneurinibacillus migulanus]KIV58941.1 hypothetical protein TS64_04045 [Aneurinibacillus migulanus]KPD05827.1 hypothetical protein AM501_23935 [Aneurinibacillus migulanus]
MIKKYRGLFLLILGIVLAGLAAYIGQKTIQSNVKTSPVVRVKKEIVAFQPIKKEQVEVKQIAISAIPPNPVTRTEDIVGKNLNTSLAPGAYIQSEYLAKKDGEGLGVPLSEKKNPRLRVITLPGSLIVKRGYINTGDHVDIIGAIKSNKDTVGEELASNVEVIAISKDEQRENITISLLLDVDAARRVHLFKTANGDIEYLLRPYESQNGSQTKYSISDIVGKENSEPYVEPKKNVQQ